MVLTCTACHAAPRQRLPLVDGPAVQAIADRGEWPGEHDGACADADWRAALLCDEPTCAAGALGADCAACLGREPTACAQCLGAARCEYETQNLAAARAVLVARPSTAVPVGAGRIYRVGETQVSWLGGAAPNGSLIAVVQRLRTAELGYHLRSVAMDLDANELWSIDNPRCQGGELSPQGHWIAATCAGQLRVYEATTGFQRFEVEVADWVRFGSDHHLLVKSTADQWHLYELPSGEKHPLGNIERGSLRDIALSGDGKQVATIADRLDVFAAKTPGKVLFSAPAWAERVAWQSPTIIVAIAGSTYRRYDLDTAKMLEEVTLPGEEWGVEVNEIGIVAGRADDVGLRYIPPNGSTQIALSPVPPGVDITTFGYDPGRSAMVSGWALLRDGRVVTTSTDYGVTVFGTDAEPIDTGLSRGKVLWLRPGVTPDEMLFGSPTGAWSLDLRTGAQKRLAVPTRFHLVDLRAHGDRLVGIGADLETRVLDQVWIGDRDGGDAVVVKGFKNLRQAVLDGSGALHVFDEGRLITYELGAKPREVRSLKTGSAVLDFSADGSMVVVVDRGTARVLKTADYSEFTRFDAFTCAFAIRAAVLACVESTGSEGQVRFGSVDLRTGRVLAAGDGTFVNGALRGVSDDGRRLLSGWPDTTQPLRVLDLGTGSSHLPPDGRYSFTAPGELIIADSTYLSVYSDLPAW